MAVNYCGGIPEIPKAGVVEIVAFPDSIKIIRGFSKSIVIPYDNIKNISMKTDEQISKDVTLTRVLALGIFALAAKKKTKVVTNYLLIDYDANGIECTAVFTGDKLPKVVSKISKARQKYLKSNNKIDEISTTREESDYEYSDIEKLVIKQYRNNPEVHKEIHRLLNIEV
ncbi:hypothetical protein [Tepidibacter thalassicus]|uniref:Uncharacterized protein n=1 Tax=Tepidibacter thalassicus DSM 15285 TaxID=1123350 RepID=A0A1M5NJ19_9FIRM|nr:hypothetical protein [Tepidibacter thalassicus]SHG89556.1 hypothetical protein SAMN02744040_00070 [Tepidibacter thalassicus DSM 15285]